MKLFILIIICPFTFNSSNYYLFSIIISIFNTGRYLDDSISSIIQQTIGFNKIQLILINDGSSDNSESICLKYKNLYEKNIIYIKIPHSGVSNSRNIGLKYAKGKYINFLDSDDKWDLQALYYINLIFKLNINVDLLGCRIKCFESSDNYHFLDYKFQSTKIVNLTQEYNYIHLSVASSFFRRSILKGKKFIEGIFLGEDVRFITNILLFKPIVGFVREALYYYRKRADSTSAIQNTENNYKFYFYTIENVHQFIINESIKVYGKIIPFIQFYIAYELLFRIQSKAYLYLELIDYNNYCRTIINLIKQIEDKYFLEQKIFPSNIILFTLSKKYGEDKRCDIKAKNNLFIYSNYIIINLKYYKSVIIWKYLELKQNKLHLEGEDRLWLPRENYFYFCLLGKKKFFPKYSFFSGYDHFSMFGIIRKGRIITFDIIIDIKKIEKLSIYLNYKNVEIELLVSLNTLMHLSPINNSYYASDKYIISNKNNNLFIYPFSLDLQKSLESEFSFELRKQKKKYLIKYRKKLFKNQNKRIKSDLNQIWLINDRKNQAGDNGEYFFRYLISEKHKEIDSYFIIEKNCTDYNRLKVYGNVVDLNSPEYLNYFFQADKIISSVVESWVNNPLGEDGKYLCDYYNFKLIYLTNGIIKDDLSKYLNKIITNFHLIITSSYKEYKSLINIKYGYTKNNIALTGLPRFDYIKNKQKKIEKQKIIAIFPTWRMYIKGVKNLLTHESIKSDKFMNTTYYNFYNDLINNPLLLDKMNQFDYRGIFCLDPNFQEQYILFKENKLFDIRKNCNKKDVIIQSSLLVTDYSNIFFDFGYIKKPVIYSQFDYEEYRKYHFKEGYFNYKNDGFGPICYNINCTIKAIINAIENNCHLQKFYLSRIRKFFFYFDEQNNKRIYFEIIGNKERDSTGYHIYLFFLFILLIKNKNYII